VLNAAIVGVGWWGQKIVKAVQGRSERLRFLRAVTKEPEDARAFAAQHGLELSEHLPDVLSDPRIEAVVLATPHSLHVPQIIEVAASGRAVFCEKPLALNKADAHAAIEACRKRGVALGIGTNKRFWPSSRELARLLDEASIGELLHLEGNYTNENSGAHFSAWRTRAHEAPAAGMTGAGIHVLDALVRIGGRVESAYTQVVRRKPQPDPLDTVSVVMRFRSGVSALLGTVRSSTFYWRIHAFGSHGSIEALGENEVVLRRKGCAPALMRFEPVDSLLAEFDGFADAVAGVRPYITTPEEMLNVVEAFEAIVRSAETATPVRVE
jgi:predicted dehydrogenase